MQRLIGKFLRAGVGLAAVAVLSACAAQPPVERALVVASSELLSGSRLGVPADARAPSADLTAVNADMRNFLRQHVPEGLGPTRTIELILQAILDDGLQLRYDNFRTLTAAEAFYSREGNCMSFTNLFVALAREAGIKVHYQEVEIPPSWTAEGDTWRYNLHINALVKLPGAEQVVDFNLGDYDPALHRRVLTDEEAQVRYHNNMGVHWMTAGEHERAFLQFREALLLRPRTAHVWTNLGTLYRRGGDLAAAESSYLHAVELADDAAANSNLARLYAELGEQVLSKILTIFCTWRGKPMRRRIIRRRIGCYGVRFANSRRSTSSIAGSASTIYSRGIRAPPRRTSPRHWRTPTPSRGHATGTSWIYSPAIERPWFARSCAGPSIAPCPLVNFAF